MRLDYKDVDKMLDLLEEAYNKNPLDLPPLSRKRARRLLTENIENPKFLIAVDENITATIILSVSSTFFSEKQQINEIVFYSKTAGNGFRLLKEAEEWIKGWGDSIGYSYLVSEGGPKVDKMLDRYGMKRIGTVFKFDLGEDK